MAQAPGRQSISQEILFGAIAKIYDQIQPSSVQEISKKIYKSVFPLFFQSDDISEPFPAPLNEPINHSNAFRKQPALSLNEHLHDSLNKNLENKISEPQQATINASKQNDGEQKQPDFLLTKTDFAKLPAKEKIELLKTIKSDNISSDEKEKIRLMKINVIKSSSKFYRKMLCKPVQIDFEPEPQPQKQLQSKSTTKTIDKPPADTRERGEKPNYKTMENEGRMNNFDPHDQLKRGIKKQEKDEIDDEELKKWFNDDDNEKGAGSDLKKMGNDAFAFLDQEPEQHHEEIEGQQYSASQLRQHYEISKALCIYSERYNEEEVASIDPLDNPQFVETYFNFPEFSKQDRIQLQTNKDQFLDRLHKSIDVLKVFLKHGYGLKIYKQATGSNEIGKDRYTHFIWFALRLGFRQVQKYLIKNCQKNIPILTYTETYLISLTLFRIRQMYSEKSKNTFFQILKAVFKFENIVHITKNDIFYFYNELRKKLVERRDAIQTKLTMTIEKQSEMTVKYYNYSEDGQIDFFGHENGIEGIKTIYDDGSAVGRVTNIKEKTTRWSEEFELQYLKLYMQYKKLGEIRRHLLKRFKGPLYEVEFDLKKSMYTKLDRIFRACIDLLQGDYRRYCEIMGIYKINFYQRKLLQLNYSEMRVICMCEEGIDCRLLIFDYYLNNKYGKNRNDKSSEKLVKYRLTYLNYIIESMAELLEHKKKLAYILIDPDEDRYKLFDIRTVQSTKNLVKKKDIINLEEDNSKIHEIVVEQLQKIKKFWETQGFHGVSKLDKQKKVKVCKQEKVQHDQQLKHQQSDDTENAQADQQDDELNQKQGHKKSKGQTGNQVSQKKQIKERKKREKGLYSKEGQLKRNLNETIENSVSYEFLLQD